MEIKSYVGFYSDWSVCHRYGITSNSIFPVHETSGFRVLQIYVNAYWWEFPLDIWSITEACSLFASMNDFSTYVKSGSLDLALELIQDHMSLSYELVDMDIKSYICFNTDWDVCQCYLASLLIQFSLYMSFQGFMFCRFTSMHADGKFQYDKYRNSALFFCNLEI